MKKRQPQTPINTGDATNATTSDRPVVDHEAVFNSLSEQIAVLDRSGNIIAVNEAWKRFGIENGGVATGNSVELNYLDVCQRAQESGDHLAGKALNGIQGVLDGKLHNFLIEYPCNSPNEVRWFLMSVTPLCCRSGEAVVSHINITSRKQAEETREQARRQAEEANRIKDEFLTLVSHELRSPLNAMLGYARLLRYGPLDAQRVKESVDVIERNAKTQTQLIDDLLDTARIISGKLRLDTGTVDLAAVIHAAVQTIQHAAEAKKISINIDLDPTPRILIGDPERLQQVVWNLLSNAVKFTPPGGAVAIRMEHSNQHVCVSVRDTGKGISPEFLPYVFDRFRQADHTSTRRFGGLGLGLALVKYLVELHGGTVEAFSDGEGRGATFKVVLPVQTVS